MEIREINAKRAQAIEQARALVDRADAEKRDLTTEENQQYDMLMADAAKCKGQAEREQALKAEEAALAVSAGTTAAQREQPGGETRQGYQAAGTTVPERREYRANQHSPAFEYAAASAEQRQLTGAWVLRQMGFTPKEIEQRLGPSFEMRALQADLDASGGFLRPAEEFIASVLQGADNLVFVRQRATVVPTTNAEEVTFPRRSADLSAPAWVAELSIGTLDTSLAFGQFKLNGHPLAVPIKVSNTLMRVSSINVDDYVRSRISYQMAVTMENAYLNGNGSGQPLGVFVASASGINTDRDVSTGNTTTSIQTDGLQECYWTLLPQYRAKSEWCFHTDALKQIAKLKDGDGQYIWQRGNIATGVPDTLLTRPYFESRYAPNTFTTGLYVGIIGVWSEYYIRDVMAMQIQVLRELYAGTNETGFVSRYEGDGKPAMAEAFARVKLA